MGLKNDSLNKKTFLLCEALLLALITRTFCKAAYLIFQGFFCEHECVGRSFAMSAIYWHFERCLD